MKTLLNNDPVIAPTETAPWASQKINKWYEDNSWPVGCNYIPHNAINQLEMWQAETFDVNLIDKELGWAAELGFNTMRVFLHHLLWEQDSAGFISRIETFLTISNKHGIKPMFVLFDGVWDPFPKTGTQPLPRNLVHNSGWVQSPGFDVLNDTSKYDDLHAYVHGIVHHFKNDTRVLIWDIFNEPDNMNTGSYKDDNYVQHKAELAINLLKKAIGWIREINPVQPITMAPWQCNWSDHDSISALDNYMFLNSDIISFHCYENKVNIEKIILQLKRYGKPMVCTEYMARPLSSTFEDILPVLQRHNVGAYNWGFVAGKSQTNIAWDSWHTTYETEPELWFHDILRPDGKPYCEKEAAYLIRFNREHAC